MIPRSEKSKRNENHSVDAHIREKQGRKHADVDSQSPQRDTQKIENIKNKTTKLNVKVAKGYETKHAKINLAVKQYETNPKKSHTTSTLEF